MAHDNGGSLLFPNGFQSVNLVIALIGLAGLYVVGNALYFLTFHPLAKVPGPKLCAISRIPFWIQYMRGSDVKWTHNLHQKYGPLVRYGPTDISCASAQGWKDVHGFIPGTKIDMEKAQEAFVQPVNGVPSILTTDLENHTRVRKLFQPAFSERALKSQEPLFQKYVDLLISKLHELIDDGSPVEMMQLYNFTTFDIMAELCFGYPLGLLAKNEFSPWVSAIFGSIKMMPISSLIAYYPITREFFARFEPKSIRQMRVEHCKHAEDRVNHRLQEGSDKPDIWNLVMKADGSEKGLTLREMHSNAELFMIAGSETTATLLSGLTYLLLVNPDKMQKLVAEIRSAAKDIKDVHFDTTANLKYMNACIKEALRMYPPVPFAATRVVPAGGLEVMGAYLPAETRVGCHHYSSYYSEANFKDAGSFAPERWLGDSAYAGDAAEAWQPFGYGARDCIGRSMAMHEMRLILAHCLFSFDFELYDQSQDWMDQETYALWIKKPLMCRLKPVRR
ncbi:cytochrome P450 [Pestalotiopsis sp. NC0098]|nr:cytochrome P450 [Pestalotiopsis sp. NC0098]